MKNKDLKVCKSQDEIADILGKVIDDYLELRSQGELPPISDYLKRYPQCASAIQQAINALDAMEQSIAMSQATGDGKPWKPAKQLGDFHILSEIGRGGMGIVYEAEQISVGGRKVALKVLPFATMVDPKRLHRFHNEVRAVASLNHPNVVAIYAVGEERGVHYFAMQLIRGQSLATVIHQLRSMRSRGLSSSIINVMSESFEPSVQEVSVRDAADCEQVAFEDQEAESDLSHRAFAADFETRPQSRSSTTKRSQASSQFYRSVAELGIQAAEALEHAHQQGIVHRDVKPGNLMLDVSCKIYLTDFGLAQMEQDAGLTLSGDLIGTLRYMAPEQAFANRVPIDHRVDIYSLGISLYELLTTQPAFDASSRAELLKQISFHEPKRLQKIERTIPADLATIIHKAIAKSPNDRYLTAESLADDLKRFLAMQPIHARRSTFTQRAMKWIARHQAITCASIAASLLVCFISLAAFWKVALTNRKLSDTNQNLQTQTALAQHLEKEASLAQARISEEKALVETQRSIAMDNLYLADMRQGALYLKEGQLNQLHELLEKYIPDNGDRDLRSWEWYYFLSECYSADKIIVGHTQGVSDLKWSPDGTKLASGSADNSIRVWNADSGQEILSVRPRSTGVQAVDWSPDGKQIIAGTAGDSMDIPGGKVFLWSLSTDGGGLETDYSGKYMITDVAWSPNGRFYGFAENTIPGVFTAWDRKLNSQAARERLPGNGVHAISWSQDSRWVALAVGKRIVCWDIELRKEIKSWTAHQSGIHALQLSHDNSRIASGAYDGTMKTWNSESGQELLSFNHPTSVNSLDWSPDDRFLLAGTVGQMIYVWDGGSGAEVRTLRGHTNRVSAVDWHPHSPKIATASYDRTIRIWDVSDVSAEEPNSGFKPDTIISPDGRFVAVWHMATDGTNLVIRQKDSNVCLLETQIARPLVDDPRHVIDWDSGNRVAVGNGKNIEVWELGSDSKQLFSLAAHHGDLRDVCWSHDEKYIASSSDDGTVRIWNAQTRELDRTLLGHDQERYVAGISWSPDDTKIAAGGWDSTVRIWSLESGLEIKVLRGHSGAVWEVDWNPEGDRLASRQMSGNIIKLWDTFSGQEVLTFDDVRPGSLQWSHDGRQLLLGESMFDSSRGHAALESRAYFMDAAWRYFDRAFQLATSGRFEEAETAWKKALTYNPNLSESEGGLSQMASAARFQFGNVLAKKGDHRRAIAIYRQATEKFPMDSFSYFGMGDSLFALGDYDRAIEAYLSGALVDKRSNPFRVLAHKFDRIGDYSRALDCYERAYEMRPDRIENANNLAWFLATCPAVELRDTKRAVQIANIATSNAPEVAGFWNTLGVAHYRNGENIGCVNALKRSVELKSRDNNQLNPDAYDLFFLGMAQNRLGKVQLAKSNLERAADWMKRYGADDNELMQIHEEAASLITLMHSNKTTEKSKHIESTK